MAGEIQLAHTLAVATLYAHVWNNVGQIYNTVLAAFEAYATANIGDYDVAMTEQGTASRFYIGTFPAVAAGYYHVTIQSRIGASPAEADPYVGDGEHYWMGSALYAFPNRADYTAARAAKIDNLDAAVSSSAAPGEAMALTAAERDSVAAALLDLANGIEAGFTLRQTLRLVAAVLCAKASGGPGASVFRSLGDTADRVAHVADSNGNRTTATLTP